MKTILFSTDFSKNAVYAAQYAGILARSLNARVVLLNVHASLISIFKKRMIQGKTLSKFDKKPK